MKFETIICDVRPPIAELVLNRPEDGNTFTAQLLAELAEATTRLSTDPDIRVVVLRGNGKHFCFGANVDMFCDHPQEQRPALIRDLVTKLHLAVTRLTRLEVPGPTQALGWCKRLVFDGLSQSLDAQLENEAVTLVRSFTTADSDEGFRAFREHRPPKFQGN